MRVFLLVVIITLLVVEGRAMTTAVAQGAPSITITKPAAAGDIVPDGDDFATTVLGNPWDMSETIPTDIESTLFLDNVTISNGIWRGVARNNDPQLFLLSRGFGQSDPCCGGALHWKNNDGFINPINADTYHIASIRMKLTGSNPVTSNAQFFWFREDTPGSLTEISNPFQTFDGWQTYTVDLKTHGTVAGTWSGIVRGLRLNPTATPGTTIEID
jgi:hypothetical protein